MAEIFTKWRSGLAKTGKAAFGRLKSILGATEITQDTWDELEALLIQADVGIETSTGIIESLQRLLRTEGLTRSDELWEALQAELRSRLTDPPTFAWTSKPSVIMMVGVNGSGKTTTIGKLARRYQAQGLKVMLAAGDTYRAAAIEQLQVWGERNNVPVIAQQPGADPAAVVYDAFEAARARGCDVLLADTAGRLQNKAHLMQELQKVVRVAQRLDPAAPHEKMIVLDASLGQNALAQAEVFHEAIGLTGITMTKLDAGGRGGVLLALAERLDIPFRFIGIGEQAADMDVFDADEFATALTRAGSPAPP